VLALVTQPLQGRSPDPFRLEAVLNPMAQVLLGRNVVRKIPANSALLAFLLALLALNGFHAAETLGCGGDYDTPLESLFADDQPLSPAAIEKFRAKGYAGLDELFELRKQLTDRRRDCRGKTGVSKHASLTKRLARLDSVIDQVGGQRYCSSSRLFWHTDLAKALVASKQAKKPVLSLRMLGNLTDEYSCANSRFFRTTLYANQAIAKQLREHFVLHWKTVRPVPRITIDFGDGRQLERTLTGNSAHYVLDEAGRPLDCLPGLYGPGAFTQWLNRAESLFKTLAEYEPSPQRTALLVDYHQQRNRALGFRLQGEMARVDPSFELALASRSKNVRPKNAKQKAAPRAEAAAMVAVSKSLGEVPILKLAFGSDAIDQFEERMNADLWQKLAAVHAGSERLDRASIELIRSENPTAADAGGYPTALKSAAADPILRLLHNLQRSILLDTVRNEYVLHRKIHDWFVAGKSTGNAEELNRRVYAELFLTPDTDPWLGLSPKGVYTALENAGLKLEKQLSAN